MRGESAGFATQTLFLDGAGALLTLPDNTVWFAEISISVKGDLNNLRGGGKYIVTIERGAGAGTTAFIGPITTVHNSFTVAHTIVILPDNVNGALDIACSNFGGIDNLTRWVATVRVTQVTY